MVLYPEVLKHAQAEIDQVVGQHRLPMLSDWDNLPYLGAVIKEVLRWHPVTPQGKRLFVPPKSHRCSVIGNRATAPANGGRYPGRVSHPEGYSRHSECLVRSRLTFYLQSAHAYPLLLCRQLLHDSDIYTQPMEFNPSRFLGETPERDPTDFCFGFGRR